MGRAHAVMLSDAGADVVLCDRCADTEQTPYPLATQADLDETVAAVESRGRKALAIRCDVRNRDGLKAAVDASMEQFGRIDILLANAGVSIATPLLGSPGEDAWDEEVGINLTGVYNSMRAVAPVMAEQRWGRIVATSSMLGRTAMPTQAAYVAAKWGVIGLVKAAAQDLAGYGVTVNAVAPGNINTPMIQNEVLYRTVRPDLENPTAEDAAQALQMLHVQPIPWLDPSEISSAILFLIGSEHITGTVIDVNAGASARFTA
jgi:NAD(P)-dependent dehydrogenase (short-subunit alcohol dehydrogenase family)